MVALGAPCRRPVWCIALFAVLVVWAAFAATALRAEATCRVPATPDHVFFVTDREPVIDDQFFSGERGLTSGHEAVISRGALDAQISRTGFQLCRSQLTFFNALRSDFAPHRAPSVLIYIHGYYTTFRQAVQNALTIQRTLQFTGPVVVYSWPSKVTSRLTYMNDESNANWSIIHFRNFLASLAVTFPNVRISFAAHSLGARFAGDGIDFLRYGICRGCLGPSAFFAPDVDGDTLRASLEDAGLCHGPPPPEPSRAAPITLYVSNRDRALRDSQALHGHQRAGQAGNEMLLCSGVDTVDVGYVKVADRMGHSYQVDPRVAADLRNAFNGIPPSAPSRNLTKAARDGGTYYDLH